MKILLIRPSAYNRSMARVLPLGLLAIGSILKQNGYDVKIADLRISDHPQKELETVMREFDPDIVGIGIMTVESRYGFAEAARIKRLKPEVKIVFGGPHCAHEPQFILCDPNVDYMVCGEGDLTIVELVRALDTGGVLEGIEGIAFRKDGGYVKTPDRPVIRDLDTLRNEYDLIDPERYFNFKCAMDFFPAYRNRRFIPIVTSRGCPFKCTYCHDIFDKSTQYKSAKGIVDEMEYLVRTYKVGEFSIVDDVFNLNMKRAKEVMDEVIRRGLKVHITFPNGLRADFFDDELIAKMRRAGVYRMALGIESGSQRIQDQIKKDLDIGILPGVVEKLSRNRISVHGFFMLGFPTETREEMEATIDFACSLPLTTANFSLVIPNPGTELRDTFIKERADAHEGFSEYSYDYVNCNASRVQAEELAYLRKEANRRFYFSLKRARHVLNTVDMGWLMRSAIKTPFALLWKNTIAPTNAPTMT
ncbi:MAG: radical SAM protein [Nitrospinae bacterium CG11_big_fil_rev_8_21_14_0_20_56_8]|nr:MAG: radical SAM protein [Nitrospinae bacterium CG11_big_fil_rev_8_21_14_0_20_56_8]